MQFAPISDDRDFAVRLEAETKSHSEAARVTARKLESLPSEILQYANIDALDPVAIHVSWVSLSEKANVNVSIKEDGRSIVSRTYVPGAAGNTKLLDQFEDKLRAALQS